jgi:hypothetical protein
MKRKLLLTIVSVISGIILVNAQCTPSATCLKGICPDTIANLPIAHVSVPYSTYLTVVVPADTTLPYVGSVAIDSLNYTSTTGLPTGFTATPDKSGWKGNTKGCLLISGTPTIAMQGVTYKLTINVTAHAMSLPLSVTYKGYKIFVNDTTLGIKEINAQNGVSFYYNFTDIKIHSNTVINDASIIVNDITGRELMHLSNLNGNDFTINKGRLSNGIYIISLINNRKVIARGKVIIG